MVPKTPSLVSDFHLVIAVSELEFCGRFSDILATTFITSDQINDMVTVTVQSFSNVVGFASVLACKFISFYQNGARHFTFATFMAASIRWGGFPATLL